MAEGSSDKRGAGADRDSARRTGRAAGAKAKGAARASKGRGRSEDEPVVRSAEAAPAGPANGLSPTVLAQIAFALLAGLAVYAFVTMARHAEARHACEPILQLRPQYVGADRTAPDFDLEDGKGGRIRLADHRGKVIILHFWTKTCAPCLEELPRIARFAEQIKNRKDVTLITVTIDDGPAAIKDVLAATFPDGSPPNFVIAYDRENAIVRGKYGTKLFPETWLVDPGGVVRARFDGEPRGGEGCDSAWNTALLLSAIDALKSPVKCDLVLDPKTDPNPEHRIAQCQH